MIEKYGLFDSVEGDEREYAEIDLARFGRALSPQGVRGDSNALRVAASPTGLGVTVAPGLAVVQGRYYELVDDGSGAFTLNLSAASAYPRIDRIVLKLDHDARTVKLGVLKGTEAASPQPPELVRSASRYMLSLAQVRVAVGAGSLSGDAVTDERANASLCGLMPQAYTAPVTRVNGKTGNVVVNRLYHSPDASNPSGYGSIVYDGSRGCYFQVYTPANSSDVERLFAVYYDKSINKVRVRVQEGEEISFENLYTDKNPPKIGVNGAKEGHVAVFDANGNIVSSGKSFWNFTRANMTLSGTTLTITTVN